MLYRSITRVRQIAGRLERCQTNHSIRGCRGMRSVTVSPGTAQRDPSIVMGVIAPGCDPFLDAFSWGYVTHPGATTPMGAKIPRWVRQPHNYDALVHEGSGPGISYPIGTFLLWCVVLDESPRCLPFAAHCKLSGSSNPSLKNLPETFSTCEHCFPVVREALVSRVPHRKQARR